MTKPTVTMLMVMMTKLTEMTGDGIDDFVDYGKVGLKKNSSRMI